MQSMRAVFLRELRAYFLTPLAYIFIIVFLLALGVFTWEIARFFDTGRADLSPFFMFHPWLYVIFLPAIAMRLWAEDIRGGMVEILMSSGVPLWSVILGKFLAAWFVAACGLVLTFPMWWTVNYLGPADNAIIFLSYFMSLLMAGGYLAIGMAMSALTGNQVTAFVLGVVVCFCFTVAGFPMAVDLLGNDFISVVANISFLTHFQSAQSGVLELRALVFFVSLIALFLGLSWLWIERRREVA